MDHLDLVSLEDIQTELQQLGLDIDENDVLERMKNLCILFNISCEKLVEAWYSYQLKRKIRGQPSIAHLEQFEKNVLTKEYVKQHDLKLDKGGDIVVPEQPCSDEPVTSESDPKVEVTEAEPEIQAAVENECKTDDEKMEIETESEPVTEPVDAVRDVRQVSCYIGESLEEEGWKRTDTCDFEISEYDSKDVLDKNYKILDLRLQDFADLMDDVIAQFQDDIIDNRSDIGSFTDLAIESAAPAFFCGRIVKEIQGTRINSKSIILEGNGFSRKRIKLDVDGLNDFSLFPGQIVGVKAINCGDRGLQALEILDPQLTLPHFPPHNHSLKKSMFVSIAAGPFGPETTVSKMVDQFKSDQPHLIILMEPFVPSNDPDILDPKLLSSNYATSLVERILKVTTDSKIIVVPSPNDFFTLNVIPTTNSAPISTSERVYEASSPGLVNVSGCVFGLSTTDVILDLLKEEYSITGVGGERMKRLHEHLLTQKSFYPLFPPSVGVNIDYSQFQQLRIPVRPHILIIPSDSKNFCRNIFGTICINPERVSKKSLARLKLEFPSDDFSGSIENYANAEVFKF